jgi:hypothetical protein
MVSVHDHLAPLLWVCGEAEHHGGEGVAMVFSVYLTFHLADF